MYDGGFIDCLWKDRQEATVVASGKEDWVAGTGGTGTVCAFVLFGFLNVNRK